ncbi:hypothetical protein ACNFU2_16010 [Chryseobacterium sp. PTM-20240506]|uniref:hypothetical protein n=1 Tax=unclassified Chryseobacterium TaxID=2593645 RepID=UPI0027966A13|nr:hypothetical protein [Chryseobacterium sp. CKR4-1]MDQ1804899.1 hypothetical protein [Chryseobacterium sp. CKR4-1]
MKKTQIIFAISLVIFLISLTQVAVYTQGRETDASNCFLLGWLELENNIAWLANPLLFISWLALLLKQVKVSVISSLIAFCLSLFYFSSKTIIIDEAGNESAIISFGAGYYLWVTSCLCMVVGSSILLNSSNKGKHGKLF